MLVRRRSRLAAVCLLVLVAATSAAAAEKPPDDAYVAGYAAAVLERELRIVAPSLTVSNGVVTLDGADLAGADVERVRRTLSRVPGVVRVDVRPAAASVSPPAPVAPPAPGVAPPEPLRPKVLAAYETGVLPGGQLFTPLIADPRWPHFAAAYQVYLNDPDLKNVAAVSFGETFTLYRDRLGGGWWETGIQAGVFAIFDLDAESKDLINADYLAAVVLGYRYGQFSALGRLFHVSSHLGDEFLLGNRVRNRVNLSYESVDARLSYEFFGDVLRFYGGGGYLFDQEPEDLRPWALQWGVEFRSPWPGRRALYRPIAAVDVQNRQENDWHADVSVRAGVQFEGVLAGRNLELLLEYFRGYSPNGQFYINKVDYIGFGVHFHF